MVETESALSSKRSQMCGRSRNDATMRSSVADCACDDVLWKVKFQDNASEQVLLFALQLEIAVVKVRSCEAKNDCRCERCHCPLRPPARYEAEINQLLSQNTCIGHTSIVVCEPAHGRAGCGLGHVLQVACRTGGLPIAERNNDVDAASSHSRPMAKNDVAWRSWFSNPNMSSSSKLSLIVVLYVYRALTWPQLPWPCLSPFFLKFDLCWKD